MISFDKFLKQDETDKYNMLQECNAIIQQKENIIKEVREKLNNYTTRMEVLNYQISDLTKKELLEILDKGERK